jgi:murein DD-endopeptidase MepM/ murein hydrolase activator NlpD
MRFLVRAFLLLLLIGTVGLGVTWWLAGREPGPAISIQLPEKFVGQSGLLEFGVEAPGGLLQTVDAVLEQHGQSTPLFSLTTEAGEIDPAVPDRLRVVRPIGRKTQPGLVSGPARVTIRAVRPVFYGLRMAESAATRDVQVRLEAPRVSVVSLHHFINLGGAEFAVLRVSPDDVQSGIRVGGAAYPSYHGSGAGLSDPALRVVFFALHHDQLINTPISAFARDPAGNETTTLLEHRPFAKAFVQSRIPIDDRFLDRIVPAIASNTPDLAVDTSTPEARLKAFLTINGELRRKNAETIIKVASDTKPEMLWSEAFAQLGNSQVESRFADRRTYFFGNKEIDRQVHLGFDLASVQQAPVLAANTGLVVFAEFLGIYGNCVIIDHGLGVQSLYAHLSALNVKPGDQVRKSQEIGRTGITGLAGGDHLHFSMLLQGVPVNSVEWWDPHWMEDRVFRKLREAGSAR